MKISREWISSFPKLTLNEVLKSVVAKKGKRPFLHFYDQQMTYEEFGDHVKNLREALWGHGFKEGDRAVLYAENSPGWCIAYFAAISAGGISVPLDPSLRGKELINLIKESGARVVFTSEASFSHVMDVIDEIPSVEQVVLMDSDVSQKPKLYGMQSYLSEKKEGEIPSVNPDAPCTLLFTSGTTGEPKVVPLSHKNVLSGAAMVLRFSGARKDEFILLPLPLFHVFPLVNGLLASFCGGIRLCITRKVDRGELNGAIERYPITILICVPAFYEIVSSRLQNKIQSLPGIKGKFVRWFSSIRRVKRSPYYLHMLKYFTGRKHLGNWKKIRVFLSGGAALDPAVMETYNFIGIPVMEGYGLTETSAAIALNTKSRKKLGSVGKPSKEWIEVKIDNPDGEGRGEILLKGPLVMDGYVGQPRHDFFTEDGYFRTGDIGYLDEDGYLFITGRQKDVIVPSTGKNIYPVELEAHYKKSSLVKDICILGLPEKNSKSETVHAAVIVTDQLITHGEDVAYEWLAAELDKFSMQLPAYKRIRSFNIWRGDFPRVSTGKVQKFEVKKQIMEHTGTGAEEPVVSVSDELLMTHEGAHYLCEQLIELAPRKIPIFPNTHLGVDLGMDSLRLTELLLRMEKKYNCRFPVEEMASVTTVKDAINFMERCLHS